MTPSKAATISFLIFGLFFIWVAVVVFWRSYRVSLVRYQLRCLADQFDDAVAVATPDERNRPLTAAVAHSLTTAIARAPQFTFAAVITAALLTRYVPRFRRPGPASPSSPQPPDEFTVGLLDIRGKMRAAVSRHITLGCPLLWPRLIMNVRGTAISNDLPGLSNLERILTAARIRADDTLGEPDFRMSSPDPQPSRADSQLLAQTLTVLTFAFRNVLPWLLALWCLVELRAIVITLTGEGGTGSAWMELMANVNRTRGFAFIFGLLGILYGVQQRELRRAERRRLHERLKLLSSNRPASTRLTQPPARTDVL